MIEKFPLDKVNEAQNRMTSGKAQFRVVLTCKAAKGCVVILRLPDWSRALFAKDEGSRRISASTAIDTKYARIPLQKVSSGALLVAIS
jgi:hypothetical protein